MRVVVCIYSPEWICTHSTYMCAIALNMHKIVNCTCVHTKDRQAAHPRRNVTKNSLWPPSMHKTVIVTCLHTKDRQAAHPRGNVTKNSLWPPNMHKTVIVTCVHTKDRQEAYPRGNVTMNSPWRCTQRYTGTPLAWFEPTHKKKRKTLVMLFKMKFSMSNAWTSISVPPKEERRAKGEPFLWNSVCKMKASLIWF
jgi:hypothetical protein